VLFEPSGRLRAKTQFRRLKIPMRYACSLEDGEKGLIGCGKIGAIGEKLCP